jgi:Tol biopolymer transport system component
MKKIIYTVATHSFVVASLIVAALFLIIPLSAAHADTYPKLISVATDGTQEQVDTDSSPSPASSDGRYVVFNSQDHYLVPNDLNNIEGIYVRDTWNNTTTRVDVDSYGNHANDWSELPSISADGRYVEFVSNAFNLVLNDTNGEDDIFVHDMLTGSTTRATVASNGDEAINGRTDFGTISGNGRYVAFDSRATNLAANHGGLFVHDNTTGSTTLVSVKPDGTPADGHYESPSLSSDGRYIVFNTNSTDILLVISSNSWGWNVYERDMVTGVTRQVNDPSDGLIAYIGTDATVSDDGNYVAYNAAAAFNQVKTIVRDMQTK